MRIMFMANAPWCTTGYGIQGKHLVPRLQALGHNLAYFAFYGLQNGLLNIEGVPIYPMGTQMWGQDILGGHMKHFQGELLITLLDVWVCDNFGKIAKDGGFAWCPWTPVDQEPIPALVLKRLEGAHTVLPYAKHGEDEFRKAGIENVYYIPHGVATQTFKPLDQAAARKEIGLPENAFIIGMVAANKGYPPRKCFPEQLLAFSQFKARHPEALFYLHSWMGQEYGGVNFTELCGQLGLEIGRDVIFSDQYSLVMGWPEERMALLYNCFDVLSLASSGEGFGIPLVEAQACGVPVVTGHNTAQTELTFAGISVTAQHPMWTQLAAWQKLPSPDAILDAYEQLYQQLADPVQRKDLAKIARDGALAFDWDRVIDNWWKPFLDGFSK